MIPIDRLCHITREGLSPNEPALDSTLSEDVISNILLSNGISYLQKIEEYKSETGHIVYTSPPLCTKAIFLNARLHPEEDVH